MQRILRAALVAVLLGAIPAPALAQYVMDLASLIRSLQIGDFGSLTEELDRANTVYVERVSRLAGIRMQGHRLDAVLDKRQRTLRHLRAQVRHSREALRALERHRERLQDVIFVTTTRDGTATLYVDDR